MLSAIALAVADLGDRGVLAVLAKSVIVTVLIFVGLGVLLAFLLHGADPCDWVTLGSCPMGAAGGGLGGALLAGLALWLLFPPVALGVVAAFADEVVAVVERRHYPALAAGRRLGLAGAAWLGLRGSARLIVVNLVALPLYLVLLVTGIGTLALFVAVNAVAIGSDLGEMVVARHGDRSARRAWLRATRGQRASTGLVVAALFLVPVANLLAPVLGAAAMTHLYHRRRA